jgi:hypothetical protein
MNKNSKYSLLFKMINLRNLSILFLIAALGFLFQNFTTAENTIKNAKSIVLSSTPAVGAIRWDYWHTEFQDTNPINTLRSLQWMNRLPFFATGTGLALDLDGIDGFVSIGNPSAFGNLDALTIFTRLKIDSSSSGSSPVGKESAYRFVIYNDGSGHFAIATTNNAWYTSGTTVSFPAGSLSAGVWQDLVGVYDGHNIRVYINGILKASSDVKISGKIVSNPHPVTMGYKMAADTNYFRGQIDDLLIYKRALSLAEIKKLAPSSGFASNKPPGAIGYWNFDGCQYPANTSIVPDLSGFNNKGTFMNSATIVRNEQLKIEGNSQKVVDREILYASAGSLDYWAFVYYPTNQTLNYGLNHYLKSPYKNKMKFALIFTHEIQEATYVQKFLDLIADPNYLKTPDGRPILYLFQPESYSTNSGGIQQARAKLAELRKSIMSKNISGTTTKLLNPLIVNMSSWQREYTRYLNLDASSSYTAPGGNEGGTYNDLAGSNNWNWNIMKKDGNELIPPVNLVWDPRPRFEMPAPWDPNTTSGPWYQAPTKDEFKNHLKNALWKAKDLTILDNSGNEHHGTAKAIGSYVKGRVDSAYHVNAESSYISINEGTITQLDNFSQITLSTWVKLDNSESGKYYTPVGKESAYRLTLYPNGGGDFVVATTNNPWYSDGTIAHIPSGTIKPGFWYHLVGTYNGSSVSVYVNGILKNRRYGISGQIVSSESPFTLGFKMSGNIDYFAGSIDETRLYNRVLKYYEIQALTNDSPTIAHALSLDSDGLIGRWSLNAPPNTVIIYAWNEYDEGGIGLTPDKKNNKDYLDQIVKAKEEVNIPK